jgi:Magnesium chelatase, subunit ChlI
VARLHQAHFAWGASTPTGSCLFRWTATKGVELPSDPTCPLGLGCGDGCRRNCFPCCQRCRYQTAQARMRSLGSVAICFTMSGPPIGPNGRQGHRHAQYCNCELHGCPCGYYGDPVKECTCSHSTITRYQKKISGPLLDRIDIHIKVPCGDYELRL